MNKILSLFQEKEQERTLDYLIVETTVPEKLDQISPDFMKLTDSIFVLDMILVQKYWQQRVQRKETDAFQLLEDTLQGIAQESSPLLFCEHPFSGLILFNHLKKQEAQGSFFSQDIFSQRIYSHLPWEAWYESLEQIHQCFTEAGLLTQERQNFPKQIKDFRSFQKRMQLDSFADLKMAHFFEIQRRFHSFFGQLWQWTFLQAEALKKTDSPLFLTHDHYRRLHGFPWKAFVIEAPPQIQNRPDHPLSHWNLIENHLEEDFLKMSLTRDWSSPYKILQIRWSLHFSDDTQREQDISFRFPLDLQEEEQKEFKNIKKQFSLAFDKIRHQAKERSQEIGEYTSIALSQWTLTAEKRLFESSETPTLTEQYTHLIDSGKLEELSHQIETPIRCYQSQNNFIRGYDFKERELLESIPPDKSPRLKGPQPLYLLKKPIEIDPPDSSSLRFLQRVSSDWWTQSKPQLSYQDCYLVETKDGRVIYAYATPNRQWFQYGI